MAVHVACRYNSGTASLAAPHRSAEQLRAGDQEETKRATCSAALPLKAERLHGHPARHQLLRGKRGIRVTCARCSSQRMRLIEQNEQTNVARPRVLLLQLACLQLHQKEVMRANFAAESQRHHPSRQTVCMSITYLCARLPSRTAPVLWGSHKPSAAGPRSSRRCPRQHPERRTEASPTRQQGGAM